MIYTSFEDYRITRLKQVLNDRFKDYNIIVDYYNTGNHASKLLAEGLNTKCDISLNLDYGYLEKLAREGLLADVSSYKTDEYIDDANVSNNYIIQERNGCSIAINKEYFIKHNMAEPKSYEDLLKKEYKGLIAMPNPIYSATGYAFYKSLVNAWGEDLALEYFTKLSKNLIKYTSTGIAPLNMMKQNEAVIGLGMTAVFVMEINNGYDYKILVFDEGAPYNFEGQAIIKNKENREEVKAVFDYLVNSYNKINNTEFFPEQIYKYYTPVIKNFPINVKYADMSNNTLEEKERLLLKWESIID